MYRKIIRYSNKIFNLFNIITSITDGRPKPQIATVKITTAIIVMQFSNLGSLNSLSQTISVKNLKKDIPSVSTIARCADSINLDDIRNIGKEIYAKARKSKMLSPYCGMWVGIVDGHEQTTSKYHKCSHCKSRIVTKKGGVKEVQYYHEFTAFILAGPDISFILDIEPILPGEGEISSSYRLLGRVCRNYPKAFSVVIGDGLYLKETVFNLLKKHHKYTIAVLKEERRQLFEEANSLSLLSEPKIYKQGKTYYRVWDHQISGCWDGYGKKVRVIVSEEARVGRVHSKDGRGREDIVDKTGWMWTTNLPCPETDVLDDLKNTIRICHSRWQIENQCFNETVNMWNADHIYRHSRNAIVAFLLLLFIAVNIFNIFRIRNIKDKSIKTKVFLIDKIKASFLTTSRPLPPVPIPI